MNPYLPSEVFVLDDGCEAYMDLGTYERFLQTPFTRLNNVTSGQVFKKLLKKSGKVDILVARGKLNLSF